MERTRGQLWAAGAGAQDPTLSHVLGLDRLDRLPDELGHVRDLYPRERLDDADQILLEQRVVQRGQVRADDRVIGELCELRASVYGRDQEHDREG